MIRIRKPKKAPETLRTKGKAKRKQLCDAFAANPADYTSGTLEMEFKSAIHGAKDVKAALIEAQHGKCAFCESKVTHISYGDVEHFRPKAGVRQEASDKLRRPGYYWLAYEWSNLLLSCQLCNQRHKRSLFPLVDPSRRARSHTEQLSNEEPLFIDPSDEDGVDPETLITFHEEVPIAVGANRRGRETIRALGLDRPELNEMRLQTLSLLKFLKQVILLAGQQPGNIGLQTEAADARRKLRNARKDDAQYAGMVRAAFPDIP